MSSLHNTSKINRIITFDFDQTLTIHHTGGSEVITDCTPEHIKRNFHNPAEFVELIQWLRKMEWQVSIATYADTRSTPWKWQHATNNEYIDIDKFKSNEEYTQFLIQQEIKLAERRLKEVTAGKDMVRRYLDEVLGLDMSRDYFPDGSIQAFLPNTENADYLPGKNLHLLNLMENLDVKAFNDVILVDDSLSNITSALTEGHQTLHTPKGLNQEMREKLKEMVNNHQ